MIFSSVHGGACYKTTTHDEKNRVGAQIFFSSTATGELSFSSRADAAARPHPHRLFPQRPFCALHVAFQARVNQAIERKMHPISLKRLLDKRWQL
ncbi:hypothetical protein [Comamonas jiangduensis]|uniref:hypothetical protein n=1 Tax=Comamonas jiangduensis TaxID=1194168 RepID=UPI0028A753B0|nr:hypothetical protein [Comamonas jiangduensis]